jgi:arabinofuranan 3-O-arabinosyltransferase
MLKARRDAAFTLGFAALAFLIAFWQRPGWATSDTKIDLHVDPLRFVGDVASVWTPSNGLGEVHSAQYGGYLWPMGPFYAFFHELGISPWVIQRIWYALVLFLAAWGLLLLLDQLVGRPRGIVHLVATTFFVLNPYTVVFSARTTITLWGYAALPWLLLAVHRGLRTDRGWRAWWWPAAFALMFMSTGGGVNAAVVFYMAVGPLLLMLYEPAVGHVRWRAAGAFFSRAVLISVFASLWWISALLVHVRYGIDFLQYTEQPRTIWGTNGMSESIRLMGYWTSYIGAGYPKSGFPYFSDGGTLLFSVPVVLASFLLPATAILGFVWTRRWRYGSFFVVLVVVGVTIMAAGFPDGTPLRSSMEWIYYHVFVTRFLRTTDKAAPLLALGLACLLGLAAKLAWDWLRARNLARLRTPALIAAPLALGALILVAAWPIVQGKAIDRQLTWKQIPRAWRQVGQSLDRALQPNSRAIVLPGQVFAYYKWGGTVDAILPRLTKRPVAVRYETPYADLHADDLLQTIDSLIQQNRVYAGQLRPLLGLIGAGSVVQGLDDDIRRSGAVDPAIATQALSSQGLGTARGYGRLTATPPAAGDLGATQRLPEVRQYTVAAGRGIVHVDHGQPTIVDGSAGGLADLAAFGALPAHAPIFYAGDLTATAIAHEAQSGSDVVVSDSNRRGFFLPQFTQQNVGPVLTQTDPITRTEADVNPFASAGTTGQTVSVPQGVRYLTGPYAYGFGSFPEHVPLAAFDGNLNTSWVPYGDPQPDRWFQVGFLHPMNVPYVDVYPVTGVHGRVTSLAINGKVTRVHPGWNHIVVSARNISSLRVAIASVLKPSKPGPGGIQELRIPGVHISQLLRSPLLVGKALAGKEISHSSLTYLFSRTTGDDPFRRDRYVDAPGLSNLSDRQDAEPAIRRVIFAPAARSYTLDARVLPAADAPDSMLDRLTGVKATASFTSLSRFHNDPRLRASSAFDGNPGTSWVGLWIRPAVPLPWIGWSAGHPLTVGQLRITPSTLPVRRPTSVQLSWPGGSTGVLPVRGDGRVVPPTAVRARAFRLTIVSAAFPAGLTARQRATRAVGIAELTVPGLPHVRVPAAGPLHSTCGDARADVAGAAVPMRVLGTVADLNAGRPIAARACDGPVRVPAGIQYISTSALPFSVDLLRLQSAAPAPVVTAAADGRVVDPGRIGRYSVSGVRLSLSRPSWIALGESFDTGWRATCDGRSLGAPRVIDGFANGWLAPAGCQRVSFTFAPQNGVNRSYVISAVVVALALLLLLFTRPPKVREEDRLSPLLELPPSRTRMHPRRAILLALALTVPLAFIFAWRSSVLIAPALAFVFWRGIGPRALAAASAGLIGIAIPLEYVIAQPNNEGGYNFGYSVDVIYAHWIGVAAVIFLGLSGWFTLAAARGRRARRLPPPSSGGPRSQPPEGQDDDASTRHGPPSEEPEPALTT